MPPARLQISGLTKSYGAHRAVDAVALDVEAGQFFCLLGPSGCGKTTLLRMVGGYAEPDSGQVLIGDQDATRLPPERRDIGMVFQSFALFPHLTALGNAAFGLAERRLPRAEQHARAEAVLDLVGLPRAAWNRRPRQLSGGEQQRVALARALAIQPRLLLLDEPLSSLDRRLREATRRELKAMQRRTGVTAVMVTHDQEDAMVLADQVGVMQAGKLLQSGTPEALYDRPAHPFVAGFLGDANLLQITAMENGQMRLGRDLILSASELPQARLGGCVLVRPENLVLGTDGTDAAVENVIFLGADRQMELRLPGGERLVARMRPGEGASVTNGTVGVRVAQGGAWLLPGQEPQT